MQILVVVNLIAFMLGVLLLLSLLTPRDRRRAGSGKAGSYSRSVSRRRVPFTKQ